IRFSPRQADLLIVAGIISHKMAPVLRQIYDQMAEPKWVMSFGACASLGGIFNVYSVAQGIDKILPVDVYGPGWWPVRECVIQALIRLQEQITSGDTRSQIRERSMRNAREPVSLLNQGQ